MPQRVKRRSALIFDARLSSDDCCCAYSMLARFVGMCLFTIYLPSIFLLINGSVFNNASLVFISCSVSVSMLIKFIIVLNLLTRFLFLIASMLVFFVNVSVIYLIQRVLS